MSKDEQNNTQPQEEQTIEQQLETLKQESQENLLGWQRARADYANLQKQSADEKARLREFIIGNFAQDLLPVLDSFEMAMKNKEVWEKVDENWRKGIEYILQQFHNTLEQYGIKPLPTQIGDEFDPNMHESMEQIDTDDDSKDGTIAEIIQGGYKNGETILRPTKVKVFSNQK